jgi:hypothetical protein
MTIKITCITKSGGNHENPYEAISRLGWVNLLNPAEKSLVQEIRCVTMLRKEVWLGFMIEQELLNPS